LSRHKLVDIVNDQGAPRLVVESWGSEPWPVLELHAWDVLGFGDVKESWTLSNLLELSIPESLLNNNVK